MWVEGSPSFSQVFLCCSLQNIWIPWENRAGKKLGCGEGGPALGLGSHGWETQHPLGMGILSQ